MDCNTKHKVWIHEKRIQTADLNNSKSAHSIYIKYHMWWYKAASLVSASDAEVFHKGIK